MGDVKLVGGRKGLAISLSASHHEDLPVFRDINHAVCLFKTAGDFDSLGFVGPREN